MPSVTRPSPFPLVPDQGLYPQQAPGGGGRLADPPPVAQILQVICSKENTPRCLSPLQNSGRLLQGAARIPQPDRLDDQQPLEHCGQPGVQHPDLSLGKFLQQHLPGVPGTLDRPAEGLIETDAQHRLPPRRNGPEGVQIVLDGGHGGPGKHPGVLRHLPVKLLGGDVPLLPVIVLPIHGDIVGDQGDPQLLRPLPPQVTGAVADDLKLHSVCPPTRRV